VKAKRLSASSASIFLPFFVDGCSLLVSTVLRVMHPFAQQQGMLRVRLPWPEKELSPNARLHWSRKGKAVRQYRDTCYWQSVSQLGANPAVPAGPLALTLEFAAPNRRSYDRDNLLARMKAGLDGFADALGIDDRRFATLVVRTVAPSPGGFVFITVEADPSGYQEV